MNLREWEVPLNAFWCFVFIMLENWLKIALKLVFVENSIASWKLHKGPRLVPQPRRYISWRRSGLWPSQLKFMQIGTSVPTSSRSRATMTLGVIYFSPHLLILASLNSIFSYNFDHFTFDCIQLSPSLLQSSILGPNQLLSSCPRTLNSALSQFFFFSI